MDGRIQLFDGFFRLSFDLLTLFTLNSHIVSGVNSIRKLHDWCQKTDNFNRFAVIFSSSSSFLSIICFLRWFFLFFFIRKVRMCATKRINHKNSAQYFVLNKISNALSSTSQQHVQLHTNTHTQVQCPLSQCKCASLVKCTIDEQSLIHFTAVNRFRLHR